MIWAWGDDLPSSSSPAPAPGVIRVTLTLRAEARPGQGPVRHRSIVATFTLAELCRAIATGSAAWGEGERADVEAMISLQVEPGPGPGKGPGKTPPKNRRRWKDHGKTMDVSRKNPWKTPGGPR